MQRALTLHQTTVGKKVIMAVSGVILVGFTIGHLLGNLQLEAEQAAAEVDGLAALKEARKTPGPDAIGLARELRRRLAADASRSADGRNAVLG